MTVHVLQDNVMNMVTTLGDAGVFIGMMLESSIIPIPSEVVIMGAGAIGIPLVSILVFGSLGSTLGGVVGYLLGMLLKENSTFFMNVDNSLSIIGFIIPGLIATWMDRQGTVQTIASTLTIAIIVKLIIIMLGIEVVL